MISNPENGFCDFELGNFKGKPSYLTDVPVDLLKFFIDYYSSGNGMVCFDEKGTKFTLVLANNSLFIIEERNEPILHIFSEIKMENLEKELLEDIKKDINGWAKFIPEDKKYDFVDHKHEINQKIEILNIIKERRKMIDCISTKEQ